MNVPEDIEEFIWTIIFPPLVPKVAVMTEADWRAIDPYEHRMLCERAEARGIRTKVDIGAIERAKQYQEALNAVQDFVLHIYR